MRQYGVLKLVPTTRKKKTQEQNYEIPQRVPVGNHQKGASLDVYVFFFINL